MCARTNAHYVYNLAHHGQDLISNEDCNIEDMDFLNVT